MPKIDPARVKQLKGSLLPEPFRNTATNRIKRALGDAAGLTDFGVNLVRLPPGEWSSQRHWHSHSDEFVYVLQGRLTLVTDAGRETLNAGDCAAFPKAAADGHAFVNTSVADALYLEIGSRHHGDVTEYPDIDLRFDGHRYTRKDGQPY